LYGGFLIHAENGRVQGRVQIQADDIRRLLFEVRIIAGQITFQPMRPDTGRSPDSVNRILADAQMLGQFAARPMGRTVHWFPARCLQNSGLQPGRDHRGFFARMPDQRKALDSLLFKSRFLQRDRRSCRLEPLLNLTVRSPLRQHWNQARSKYIACW
jgi:hypothetical protein